MSVAAVKRALRLRIEQKLRDVHSWLLDELREECVDASPLAIALASVVVKEFGTEVEANVRIDGLRFQVSSVPRHCLPRALERLDIDVSLVCRFRQRLDETAEQLDAALLGVGLQGTATGRRHVAAWHLDYGGLIDPNTKAFHPLSHFQHGGYYVTKRDPQPEPGDLLITEAPRIPHPPMDACLTLHWIVGNFIPERLERLLGETRYRRQVRDSQERYWKPYFEVAVGELNKTVEPEVSARHFPEIAPRH